MSDLTAIITPFGLLDRETQEALKAHGGPYEMYYGTVGWKSETSPGWMASNTYRAKPATPDSIDWSHVTPEYRWMARNEGGGAFLFMEEPSLLARTWIGDTTFKSATAFASYRRGTVDWRDSLVRRPD